jgi:hypothetical protein
MELKVIRSGTYTPREDDDPSGFKTRYFPDGSAIIVTEKSICFLGPAAKYEVRPSGK